MTMNEEYAADRRIHTEQLVKKIEAGTLDNDFDKQEVRNLMGKDCDRASLQLALLGSLGHAESVYRTMLPGWAVTHAYWNDERATFNLTEYGEIGQRKHACGVGGEPAVALMAAVLRARAQLP